MKLFLALNLKKKKKSNQTRNLLPLLNFCFLHVISYIQSIKSREDWRPEWEVNCPKRKKKGGEKEHTSQNTKKKEHKWCRACRGHTLYLCYVTNLLFSFTQIPLVVWYGGRKFLEPDTDNINVKNNHHKRTVTIPTYKYVGLISQRPNIVKNLFSM